MEKEVVDFFHQSVKVAVWLVSHPREQRDLMSTFENGEPAESFAHRHGSFSFDQVLGESSSDPLPLGEEDQAVHTAA